MGSAKNLGEFVRRKRKEADLTQPELAQRAGVGLRFIRELEGNKKTLRLDKVEEVLRLFGHTLAPVKAERNLDD
jgi:y4mF family transcriptional regulator